MEARDWPLNRFSHVLEVQWTKELTSRTMEEILSTSARRVALQAMRIRIFEQFGDADIAFESTDVYRARIYFTDKDQMILFKLTYQNY